MTFPIPTAALDDRIGFLGMTGSGKTYGAGACVERLLVKKGRAIIPDPLGVWWGLRLCEDGKTASPFDVVIFGGPHGDLPLTPHVGALIGETVATMRESAIIDLSQFETAASERRFMLAFLDAVYRKTSGEPVHIIFDEADMWCPERIMDKEGGDAAKLHGMVQTVVRRGRVRGLTSWLISQRPAAISKSVLSQVDGLVAFALTSVHDRKAVGLWIEGQADKEQGKEILARLPEKAQGECVVWLPKQRILSDCTFPRKVTFDSSRSPKHGEKRQSHTLPPLDLGTLKDKLATVEAETKANDPRALKAEIARLRATIAKTSNVVEKSNIPDPAAVAKAFEDGQSQGYDDGRADGLREGFTAGAKAAREEILPLVIKAHAAANDAANACSRPLPETPVPERSKRQPKHAPDYALPKPARQSKSIPQNQPAKPNGTGGEISGPQRQMLAALAWWKAMGHDAPSRAQVAAVAGWRITSGHLKNVAGSLRTMGLISYPSDGTIALTSAGARSAPDPDLSQGLHDRIRGVLTGPQTIVFNALLKSGRTLPRPVLCESVGWNETSGHVKNVLGSLRTLEIIDYPEQGHVALQEWVTADG